MKKITRTLALILVAMAVNSAVMAQKVAHLQLDSLISLMPETKKAQDIAQDYLKQLEKEITSMQTEFQTKYSAYQSEAATLSESVKKNREEELQMLQQRIEAFREQAQQDYQKKYGELSKPIYDKAKKGIDAVAKENGYKYVLDTSTGLVLYTEPTDDILPLVKKKLDAMPEAVLPGSAPATTPNKGGTTPPKTGGTTPPKTGGK
ncbi:MAG TPA: OmpH family outer membrane protein [Bacteroidia bacterium]